MVKIETKLPNEKKSRKSGKKKNGKQTRRTIWLVLIILLIFAAAFGYWGYKTIMSPNVKTADGKPVELFIPTGSNYDQVKALLAETHCIVNEKGFDWLAEKKDLPANIHPGHYVLKNGMTNNQLVNMLRGGLQTPVKVTFNNMRDVNQLAGRIASQIEADSTSLSNRLHNQEYIKQLGFNNYTIPALFLPDTYEFYWNISPEKMLDRMFEYYNDFWSSERKAKAERLGLTPDEVATVASIVEEETSKADERGKVARLYLNRYQQGMRLQADPTVKFALNDFTTNHFLEFFRFNAVYIL